MLGFILSLLSAEPGRAQGLTVLPVNLRLAPGQQAATLTVINQADRETALQVRAFAWTQRDGEDELTGTGDLLASPPMASIPAGGRQVIRLVLRRPAQYQEATYRLLLDQIPPPAALGTVQIALRLSIPVFAEPPTRVAPQLRWRVDTAGGKATLVVVNEGKQHETVRDIALAAGSGASFGVQSNLSPYILPGATRRWPVLGAGGLSPGSSLRLTARADNAAIQQSVSVGATP